MQYQLSISGNDVGVDENESRKREAEVAELAREFVATLGDVTAASASFGFISSQDLTSPVAPADHAITPDAETGETDAAEKDETGAAEKDEQQAK